MFGINQLGAVTGSVSPGGDKEWNAYFGALRDNMNARWSVAVDSYKTLKKVRETLGLPFIVDQGTGEGGSNLVGAWSSDLEQQAVNIHAMSVLITGALDDVVAGKRKVAPYQDGDDWVIERLSSDILAITVKAPGVPVLINVQTGAPENVQGTIGALWSSAVAAVLVPGAGIYLTLRAIDNLVQNTQEKTAQTIALRNGDLIKSGKATPEQAAALTKAEAEAAANLVTARGEAKKGEGIDPEKWSPLVKTVVWGGVAIMALYIVSKLVPSRGGLAANPIQLNPRQRTRRGSYWVQELKDGHWENALLNQHTKQQATNSKRSLQEAYPRRRFRIVRRQQNPEMLSSGNWSSPLLSSASEKPKPKKYHLTRVPLNRGGYTSRGRYFGIGKPLYEYESTDGEVHGFLRASSRKEAKQHLIDEQGGARFFNPLTFAALSV